MKFANYYVQEVGQRWKSCYTATEIQISDIFALNFNVERENYLGIGLRKDKGYLPNFASPSHEVHSAMANPSYNIGVEVYLVTVWNNVTLGRPEKYSERIMYDLNTQEYYGMYDEGSEQSRLQKPNMHWDLKTRDAIDEFAKIVIAKATSIS